MKTKIWIARDRDGLTVFNRKPEVVHTRTALDDGLWIADGGNATKIDDKLFPEVTYENSPVEYEITMMDISKN